MPHLLHLLAAAAVAAKSAAAAAPPAPAPPPFACAASLTATPAWAVNATTTALAIEVRVANVGGDSLPVPWRLGLEAAGDGGARGRMRPRALALFDLEPAAEGSDASAAAAASSFAATRFWQALPPGASTSVSLVLEVPAGQGVEGAAWAVSVNGVACEAAAGQPPGSAGGDAGGTLAPVLPDLPPGGEDVGAGDGGGGDDPASVAAAAAAAAPAPGPLESSAAAPGPAPSSSWEAESTQRAEVESAAVGGSRPVRALTTRDGQLVSATTGAPVFLAGVNWFGFDTPGGTTFVDGLWAGSSGLTGDLSTVVYRLQLLGFSAVRLPFSMKELFEASPKPVGRRGGCSATSPRAVAAATAPPGTPAAVLARAPPPGRGFAPSPPGTCSAYVPAHGSVLDRFAWLCDFFVRNGFVVVADYQLNTDASALEDAGKWVGRWAALARKLVAAYPATAGRVVLDIMNEPDCVGMGWQARDGKPAAGDLYLAALDAVFGVWDGFVALVEGCGQSGLARNWGDGFATDPSVLASRRLSDPRPFLDALVGRRYVGQVALAPHVYPPSISQATDEASGPGLWWRLSTSFGYLNKAGYKGHRFPIILGETGSAFADDRDLAPQLDLMKWAMLRGGGSDRRHNRVAGVFLWSWNGNAGSGHGLVDGGSWAALDHTKVAFAASYGAVPWYARAAPGLLHRVATRHTWQDEEEGEGGAQTCPVCPACGGSGNATAAAGDDDADSAAAAAAAALVVVRPPSRPGTLTTPAGQPFTMRGVAWAGFDAPARPTLAGLGRESFGDALDRLRALGFNTVKLPLSLGAVLKEEREAGEAAAVWPCAPDAAPGALAAATLPPGAAASASVAEWVSFPSSPTPSPAAAAATAALCGGGGGGGPASSSSSTPPGLARLAAVAAALAQAGLAVVLEDADGGTAAPTDPAAWVGAWSAVAGAVGAAMAGATARDNATSLLGVRLLADPASLGLAWGGGAEGDAEPAVPLASLYLAAADGVAAAAPGAWVMLAGAGAGEAAFPAGEPAVTSLLTELGARPYARRVVVAPSLDGGDGGAAPAAAAAALAALAARLAGRFPLVLGSLGADLGDPAAAAGLAGAVAALAPGCGLPACQGGGGGGPGGGGGARPAPLGGWVWGAWEGSGPGKATPVLAPPGATGATAPPPAAQPLAEGRPAPPPPPVPLPPIAWPTVALLAEGLGLAPWFLPPTAHRRAVGWAGPLPAGVAAVEAVAPPAPSPAPAPSASGGGDNPSSLYSAASGDGHAPPPPPPPPPTCRAVVRVVAAGPAAASPAPAPAGLLLVRLANLAPAGPALAPPYRVALAGPYAALLAGGGSGLVGGGVVEEEEGGGEGPGGPPRPAITGLVTADTATLWPGGSNEVVLALVVLGRADGGGSGATPGLPPAQALAPTGVAVNGAPCALEEVAVAEGGDGSSGPLVVVSAPRRSVA